MVFDSDPTAIFTVDREEVVRFSYTSETLATLQEKSKAGTYTYVRKEAPLETYQEYVDKAQQHREDVNKELRSMWNRLTQKRGKIQKDGALLP